MPPKSKTSYKRKTSYKKKSTKKKQSLEQLVKAILHKQAETKQSVATYSDYQEIAHNNMLTLSSNLLSTSHGTGDPVNGQSSNRIGDEIILKGLNIKLHLELNERYSQTTFRIMVIRAPKGGLSATQLFAGQSANKMLDVINTEAVKIIRQRYVTIYAGNKGSRTGPATSLIGSGLNGGTDIGGGDTLNDYLYSRSSKIIKIWIPGNKIVPGGKLHYSGDGSNTPKNFDYYLIVYAYSSNATATAGSWMVGAVNDCISTLYFKDF